MGMFAPYTSLHQSMTAHLTVLFCAVVFGVLFATSNRPSPAWLDDLFDNAPAKYEAEAPFGQRFDMSNLLPDDTSHYEYAGSLVRLDTATQHTCEFCFKQP
jgi:carbonic anhydrase